jgi:HB1, ASXL, restriction endonuclease HTH domain
MLESNNHQTVIVRTLKDRLGALDAERGSLDVRVQELETELAATRAAAQRCASEAIHLEGLVAFYENGFQAQAPAVGSSGPATMEPKAVDERPKQVDVSVVTPPVRRATAQWTVAWRDEAVAVLRGHGEPMHYRELYRAISARGFTFGGKSPEATFLASLSRDHTTFAGVGKGCYWLSGEPLKSDAPVAGPRRRARRPRPIGSRRRA